MIESPNHTDVGVAVIVNPGPSIVSSSFLQEEKVIAVANNANAKILIFFIFLFFLIMKFFAKIMDCI